MKQLLVALVVTAAPLALAQEIGTEITPVTPSSGVQNPPPEEPAPQPDQPQQRSGYQYRPQGKSGSTEAPAWAGTKVSASGGDFGLRASFGTSGSTALPTGSAGSNTVAAPSVGIAYFASDSFKLLVDLGVGFALAGSSVFFAANVLLGFDYMFRTPGDALRPFFHAAGSFGLAGGTSSVGINFGAQLGFGAEYFFSPSFSLNGRLLLVVPMGLPSGNFLLGAFTVSPGVGATWYL